MKKFKNIINEKIVDTNKIVHIQGYGTMEYGQLEKEILRKIEDLLQRAKKKDWDTYGESNFNLLKNFWLTLKNNMN